VRLQERQEASEEVRKWRGLARLEEMRREVVDERRGDVGDAGDDVGEDLVELERLNVAVAVGVEGTEEALADPLEPVAHWEGLVCGIGELDEGVDGGHDLVFGD
jgi:hypothetical protein